MSIFNFRKHPQEFGQKGVSEERERLSKRNTLLQDAGEELAALDFQRGVGQGEMRAADNLREKNLIEPMWLRYNELKKADEEALTYDAFIEFARENYVPLEEAA